MRRVKLADLERPRQTDDTALSVGDEPTRRFRMAMNNSRLVADAERLRTHALSYAAEVEVRLAELNQRIAQLEALSVTDDLTGLLNRRGFDDVLARNLNSAARHDECGLLAYIDLDNFKEVNDLHGHGIGDELLSAVGRYLQKNVRATDYAARLGGDEFAILFVRAEHAPTRERARSLIRGLNGISVRHGRQVITTRASLGLAYYDGNSKPEELLQRADRAMYADKSKGSRAARMIING